MPEGFIATLIKWAVCGHITGEDPRPLCRLIGLSETTPTKPDGGYIHTSTLVSAKKAEGDWTVKTASGSKYILKGPPTWDGNLNYLELLSSNPWTLQELEDKFHAIYSHSQKDD